METLEVKLPNVNVALDQDEEYFILKGEVDERIQFHDYQRIYQIPGLYEELFHNKLKCQSPNIIKDLLYKNVKQSGIKIEELKILDFGAGNGLVAEALSEENPDLIVGVDILQEAKEAALRDRPGIYREYFVVDLSLPDRKTIQKLKAYSFNAFISVAALGFNHISPASFNRAFNLIENNGWIAINLRDKFLSNEDVSGYKKTMDSITENFIEIVDKKTYVHRLSSQGNSIYYTALIGRKLKDIT